MQNKKFSVRSVWIFSGPLLHNLHYIQTGAVYVIYGCICGHFAVVMHFSKGYSVMYRD